MAIRHYTRSFRRELRRAPVSTLRGLLPYSRRCWQAMRALQDHAALREFQSRRTAGAFSPVYADLWFLYQTVRNRKPVCVLEFGSGCSTVMISQALKENSEETAEHDGRLVSLDAVEFWAQSTWNSLPDALRPWCQIDYRPCRETCIHGVPAFRHESLPDVAPDLVYLDGPPLTKSCKVAADVLELEDRLRPGFLLVVDGRWENVRFLQRHLKREYVFTHRGLFMNSTFELKS